MLNSVLSPWPFAKWGVDLIGSLPQGKYKMKFAIVAIDYYTKWVEAEPLQEITEARIMVSYGETSFAFLVYSIL